MSGAVKKVISASLLSLAAFQLGAILIDGASDRIPGDNKKTRTIVLVLVMIIAGYVLWGEKKKKFYVRR